MTRALFAQRILGAALAVLVVSACSATTTGVRMTNPGVDPGLSQAAAQARLSEYFAQTLGGSPATFSLSYAAPSGNLEAQDPSFTVPCDDNDTTHTGPLNLVAAYWVHGISNGQQDAALQALRSAFAGNGWQPRQDDAAGQKIIKASTPDGYALIANLNDVGGLSLTGSSPCFPRANADAKAVGFSTIAHP